MNLILFLLFAQVPAPQVKLAWTPDPSVALFNVYGSPLTTDANGDDSCGSLRKMGNTSGNWFLARNILSGQSYCFALTSVTNDPDVGPIESEKSDVVVAVIP